MRRFSAVRALCNRPQRSWVPRTPDGRGAYARASCCNPRSEDDPGCTQKATHMAAAPQGHVLEVQRQWADLGVRQFQFPAAVVGDIVAGPEHPKALASATQFLDQRGQTRIRILHRVSPKPAHRPSVCPSSGRNSVPPGLRTAIPARCPGDGGAEIPRAQWGLPPPWSLNSHGSAPASAASC